MSIQEVHEINVKLDRIIAYLHFSSLQTLKEHIPEFLDTEQKRVIYQACDGKTGINEIARKHNLVAMTVSNNVKLFEVEGIVISNYVKNKKYPMKIVDLDVVKVSK